MSEPILLQLDSQEVIAPTGYLTGCWRGFLHLCRVVRNQSIALWRNTRPSQLRYELWQVPQEGGEGPLQALYIGDGGNYNYLRSRFDAESINVSILPSRNWLTLPWWLKQLRQQADLMLLDLAFPKYLIVRQTQGLWVPAWLKQRVELGSTWDQTLSKMRRKTRREVQRLINKHRFQAQVVTGEAAARQFYRDYYVPYVGERYSDSAELVSEARFMRECRSGQILQLLQDDHLLGMALLRQRDATLSAVWTGVQLIPEPPAGVTDALDYYSLLYANQLNCRWFDLGGSRARLNDGLLRYKQKWGATIFRGRVPQAALVIQPLSHAPALGRWFMRNPFICIESGVLVGKVIRKDAATAALECAGLSRCDCVEIAEWGGPNAQPFFGAAAPLTKVAISTSPLGSLSIVESSVSHGD